MSQMLRMTNQRKIILDELQKLKSHPTADELYRIVKNRLPRISLGTVYRNLDLLSREGLIRQIEYGNAPKRYDGDLSSHYHVKCRQCGRVVDLILDGLPELEQIRAMNPPFDIQSIRIEFEDICADCHSEINAEDGTEK